MSSLSHAQTRDLASAQTRDLARSLRVFLERNGNGQVPPLNRVAAHILTRRDIRDRWRPLERGIDTLDEARRRCHQLAELTGQRTIVRDALGEIRWTERP